MKNDRHAAKGNKLQAVWEGGGWGVLLRPSSGKVLCPWGHLGRQPHPLPSRLLSVAPPLTIRCPLALLLQSPGRGSCRWPPATANWRRTVPEREGTAGVGVQDRVLSAF